MLRVGYGLSLELRIDDDVQVYLLGLKYVTTGQWPYFGPDIVHGRMTQVPGALQALLVAVPLALSRWPEAPLILLNVLSFAGLIVFGLYLSHRFRIVPAWLTCAWLLTLPCTLNYSVHVYNPSYLLCPSCLFFVAFLDLMPQSEPPVLRPGAAFFVLGAAVGTVIQIHSSWPLLLPFIAAVSFARLLVGRLTAAHVVLLLFGFLVPATLLLPTLAAYGVQSLFDPLTATSHVPAIHPWAFVEVAARFLSFASYKMPVVFGELGHRNVTLLREAPWLLPLFGFLWVVGVLQALLMAVALVHPQVLRRDDDPYHGCGTLIVATVALIALAFVFTSRPPIARNYFVLSPISLLAGYLTFAPMLTTVKRRGVAITIIACSVVFHLGFAATSCRSDPWWPRRNVVTRALEAGDYRLLAERRAHTRY
jgi:FtsH-binding integral membrane protein